MGLKVEVYLGIPRENLHLPLKISQGNRTALTEILPDLPPLTAQMSDSERAEFISAYNKHPKRIPNLVPILINEGAIIHANEIRKNEAARFRGELNALIANGTISAFDDTGAAHSRLQPRSLIFRDDALRFIRSIGISTNSLDSLNHKKETTSSNKQPPEINFETLGTLPRDKEKDERLNRVKILILEAQSRTEKRWEAHSVMEEMKKIVLERNANRSDNPEFAIDQGDIIYFNRNLKIKTRRLTVDKIKRRLATLQQSTAK